MSKSNKSKPKVKQFRIFGMNIGSNSGKGSFSFPYIQYKLEKFYTSNFGKFVVNIFGVVVGFFIAWKFTKYYLDELTFAQWVEPIMYLVSIVFSLLAMRSLVKGENRVARAITCVVVLFMFFVFIVPKFNIRNFDEKGNPLKWINSVSKEVYSKPLAETFVDGNGEEYFLHPETIDTCRKATKEDLFPSYNSSHDRVQYIQVYDTLFRKVFSEQGKYSSGIYWGDIEVNDIIQITSLNDKGFARFFVNSTKSIFVNNTKKMSKYSLQIEAPDGREGCKYYIELSDGAKVEILRLRRVVRRIEN